MDIMECYPELFSQAPAAPAPAPITRQRPPPPPPQLRGRGCCNSTPHPSV